MLTAENLSIGYSKEQIIFSAINFSAKKGDVVALLGVNGIGKSTLLRTIAGLQDNVTGKLAVNGKGLKTISAAERAKLISIVLTERLRIEHISVLNFIALGRSPYTGTLGNLSSADEAVVEHAIVAMKIEKLRQRQFNQLSDGEKQKVLIARALCQDTPVMVLDEPSAFLDFRNKEEIFDLLYKIGSGGEKLIIFSTHDIESALNLASKFWIMTEERKFLEVEKSVNYRKEVLDVLYAKHQAETL
jgi:iron complex transport system ATP-binding protein